MKTGQRGKKQKKKNTKERKKERKKEKVKIKIKNSTSVSCLACLEAAGATAVA